MSMIAARPWARRASSAVAKAKRPRRKQRRYVVTIGALVVAVIVNVPLLNALWTSFKTSGEIASSPPTFIFRPTLTHYQAVMYSSGYNFPHFFVNSILLSTGTALLVLVISLPSAYAIVRFHFGKRRLLIVTTGLMLIPPITFALPFYLLFQRIDLVDTVPALILADTFVNLPLGLLLVCGFLHDLPLDIEEAATVDGCSVYGVLWRIVLPLMGPAVASVAILTFVFAWDDYLFAVILTAFSATPVTAGAADFITSYGVEWGDISAATVLSIVPPLMVGFVAQRYLIRGLTLGAVKG
jgi:multiple sugar transport system permease protein